MNPISANAVDKGKLAIRVTALLPLWIALLLAGLSPAFFAPLLDANPSVFGIPIGLALIAFAVVFMLIGLAVVWNARSSVVVAIALVLLMFPALFLVILGPAIVLIAENLG